VSEPVSAPLTSLVISNLFGRGVDFDRFEWRPFREGVDIARFYGGEDDGPSAALLRYAPGAAVPVHVHHGAEHILVLVGSQRDEDGLYPAGTLVMHGPTTRHSVASDQGCIVLAIWSRPVQILEG
jgi:anti-sigma factor ChrR (cupin superfamily)